MTRRAQQDRSPEGARTGDQPGARHRKETGDVPGWVMITLMSAGIVAVLTAVAGPRLSAMLDQALTSVGG